MVKDEIEVEPSKFTNSKESINIEGIITDTNRRKVQDNSGSMFVHIPRKLIHKIIKVLDTPIEIEVVHIFSPLYGWCALLRQPEKRKDES